MGALMGRTIYLTLQTIGVAVIVFTTMTYSALAQDAPVSVLSFGVATENGIPSSNPAATARGGWIVAAMTEIPFGIRDISHGWLWVQSDWGTWKPTISLSSSSFDRFSEIAGSIGVSHFRDGLGALGVKVGLQHVSPGDLGSLNRLFWSLGTSFFHGEAAEAGFVASKSVLADGFLAPNEFWGTLRVQPLSYLDLLAELGFSADHGWLGKTAAIANTNFGWLSVGLETSRPLFFAGMGTSVLVWSVNANVSWHPVLGVSSGVVASYRRKKG